MDLAPRTDRDLFRILLGAGGVGPRLAMAILGTMTHQDIVRSIVTEDAGALTVVPGVGKRGRRRSCSNWRPSWRVSTPRWSDRPVWWGPRALESLGYSTEEINGVMGEIGPGIGHRDPDQGGPPRPGQVIAMREDSLLNPTIETDEEVTLRPSISMSSSGRTA